MPEADQVSVIIQGPVSSWTETVLTSVTTHLPRAQVVLSTWSGTEVPPAADTAEVVLSEDPGPGPQVRDSHGRALPPWNTNRMLTSTRAGLCRADRPYTLKLRTDSPLHSASLLGWDAVRERSGEGVFSERIATCSVATRPPRRMPGYLHHPSDCVQFGRTADLVHLWGTDRFDEMENIGWWERRGERAPLVWDARVVNEQVVWLSCLRRSGVAVEYPFAGGPVTAEAVQEAEDLLFANFVVLEPWQMGVSLPKLAPMVTSSSVDTYTWFDDWLDGRITRDPD